MIKSNLNIKGLNDFNRYYLSTAYPDDITFFFKWSNINYKANENF